MPDPTGRPNHGLAKITSKGPKTTKHPDTIGDEDRKKAVRHTEPVPLMLDLPESST